MQYQAPTYDDEDHHWNAEDEHENESPVASPAQSFPPSVVSDERYDNWPQAPTPSPSPCTPLRSCHTPYPDNISFFTNTTTPEKEIKTSNKSIEEDENSNFTFEDFLENSSNLQQLLDFYNSTNNNTYNNINSTYQGINSTDRNLNNTYFHKPPLMPETKQPAQEPTTLNRKRRYSSLDQPATTSGMTSRPTHALTPNENQDIDPAWRHDGVMLNDAYHLYDVGEAQLNHDKQLEESLRKRFRRGSTADRTCPNTAYHLPTTSSLLQKPNNGINQVHNNGQHQASSHGVYQEHTSDLDQMTTSDLDQMTPNFLYEAPINDIEQMLNSNLQQMTSNHVPTSGLDQMYTSDLDQITKCPKTFLKTPPLNFLKTPPLNFLENHCFGLSQNPTFDPPQNPTVDLHQKPTSSIYTSEYYVTDDPVSPATSYITHPPSLPPAEASTPTSPLYHKTPSAQILEPKFSENPITSALSPNPRTQEAPNSHKILGYEQFNSTQIIAQASNGTSNSDLKGHKTHPKVNTEPPVLPSAVDAKVDSFHSLKLGDVDPSLAAATIQYLNTGNGLPMVKYELKQKILLNINLKGKEDIILNDPAPKEYELTQEEIDKRNYRKELNRKAAAKHRQTLKVKQQEAEEKLQVEEKRREVLQEECQKMNKEKQDYIVRLLSLGVPQEIIDLHLSRVGLHGPVVQNGPGQSHGQ